MRWHLALMLLVGCSAPMAEPDAAVEGPDASVSMDASVSIDAGTFDAGAPDAGEVDAGTPDAGVPDAGVPDAGSPSLFVFTGSGNGTIGVFSFDTRDGGLTSLRTLNGGNGTSFLATDLEHGRLYAVNEGSSQVAAFAFNVDDAGLQFINRVGSGGAGPAHLSVDGTGAVVFVANYGGGSVSVLPVIADGGLGAATQTLASGGQAHEIFADPTNRFVYVPCKAADHLAQYALDAGTLTPLSPATMTTATGAGPRHLALHPTLPRAYLINELGSTLQTLAVDAQGRMTSLQTVSTLPTGFSGANTCAEVAVHPNGRFVFGSNRGHDSLARYAVDAVTGQLTLLGHTPTGGQTPRHFSIDPSGRWLLVGNQNSGSVFLFSVDAVTGALSSLGNVATVSGVSFVGFATP